MRRQWVKSKILPTLVGYVTRWIDDDIFVVSLRGNIQVRACKEYWEAC